MNAARALSNEMQIDGKYLYTEAVLVNEWQLHDIMLGDVAHSQEQEPITGLWANGNAYWRQLDRARELKCAREQS